jgi:hypothetical protein
MLLSCWTDNWVELPVDDDRFYELLQKRIADSKVEKDISQNRVMDVSGTH